jgi:hypothetical protein
MHRWSQLQAKSNNPVTWLSAQTQMTMSNSGVTSKDACVVSATGKPSLLIAIFASLTDRVTIFALANQALLIKISLLFRAVRQAYIDT